METTAAKIALSDKELELVCNTDWILTKHAIIQKIYQLFGEVQPQLESLLMANQQNLPAETFVQGAKISKGENYRQLPYVMLDYPRLFGKQDMLAIRTFFWWGNFFSMSVLLSGSFLIRTIPLLNAAFNNLQQKGFWVCVSNSPWHHHFEEDNFRQLNTFTREEFAALLLQNNFVKIARKIPLHQWQDAPAFMIETFEEMAALL